MKIFEERTLRHFWTLLRTARERDSCVVCVKRRMAGCEEKKEKSKLHDISEHSKRNESKITPRMRGPVYISERAHAREATAHRCELNIHTRITPVFSFLPSSTFPRSLPRVTSLPTTVERKKEKESLAYRGPRSPRKYLHRANRVSIRLLSLSLRQRFTGAFLPREIQSSAVEKVMHPFVVCYAGKRS